VDRIQSLHGFECLALRPFEKLGSVTTARYADGNWQLRQHAIARLRSPTGDAQMILGWAGPDYDCIQFKSFSG